MRLVLCVRLHSPQCVSTPAAVDVQTVNNTRDADWAHLDRWQAAQRHPQRLRQWHPQRQAQRHPQRHAQRLRQRRQSSEPGRRQIGQIGLPLLFCIFSLLRDLLRNLLRDLLQDLLRDLLRALVRALVHPQLLQTQPLCQQPQMSRALLFSALGQHIHEL